MRIHASVSGWLCDKRFEPPRSGPARSPSGNPTSPHRALRKVARGIVFDRHDRCACRDSRVLITIPPTSTKSRPCHLSVRPPGTGPHPIAPRYTVQETGLGTCLAYCRAPFDAWTIARLAGGGRCSAPPMQLGISSGRSLRHNPRELALPVGPSTRALSGGDGQFRGSAGSSHALAQWT